MQKLDLSVKCHEKEDFTVITELKDRIGIVGMLLHLHMTRNLTHGIIYYVTRGECENEISETGTDSQNNSF